MKSFVAFLKKEWMDLIRSGRFMVLVILFVVFGIMNPAIAKVTPWLMETMADSLAETGLIMTEVHIDAMTSWTQFFKNIPMALIAFVLIQSSIFSKEYQSGTLVLVLTKGMARYKVIVAKFSVMIFLWTFCYWICYALTTERVKITGHVSEEKVGIGDTLRRLISDRALLGIILAAILILAVWHTVTKRRRAKYYTAPTK